MSRFVSGCAALAVACTLASPAAAQQRRGDGGEWDLALTGGVVASGLTDPVYALGNVPGRATRVVVRETDRESSVNLNVAMFAQVYSTRWPWLSPMSLGFGIRNDRPAFYLGPGLRFGRHASVIGGVSFGSVQRLPAGVSEGSTLADTNALLDLPVRTVHSWFGAVTYSFVSVR